MDIIFDETTTAGVRLSRVERRKLQRNSITVKTEYGEVRVKVLVRAGKAVTLSPEYEDRRALSTEQGVPLKKIYYRAKAAAESLYPGQ